MKVILCIFLILFLLFPFSNTAGAGQAQILENYGNIPLAFTLNQGQTGSQVKFTAQGSGCSIYFTTSGTTFLLSRETEESIAKRAAQRSVVYRGYPSDIDIEREHFALKVKFLNANQNPEVTGEERLPWNSNYFIGNDPDRWLTGVPNYGRIRLHNLYEGIDLVYYGNRNRIKYDFVVRPEEDPSQILLEYVFGDEGSGSLSVNEDGELVVSTPLGNIVERKPYCYQIINGKRAERDISYKIVNEKSHGFTFHVSEYDPAYELVIDPELVYSTFLGGISDEGGQPNTLAVDADGNAYVTGSTFSMDFPITPGAFDESLNGGWDIFVVKLNASGSALYYSTFIGGNNNDNGNSIAVDSDGNAFITGYMDSWDFPKTPGNFYDNAPDHGVFVTKLDASGSTLEYSSVIWHGSSGNIIAIDDSGNAYVAGNTWISNFPVTPGAFDESYDGGEGDDNQFITKLDASGNALEYSTFFGRSNSCNINDLTVDNSGNVYVTGQVWDPGFPVTPGAFNENFWGNEDAFVSKLNASGSALEYSTFIGGDDRDCGNGIAVDGSGNAYITGYTDSWNFPWTPSAYEHDRDDKRGVFVTKLDASGSTLVYSAALGWIEGHAIAVDEGGNAYITGYTNWDGFPTTPDAFDESFNGGDDAFLAVLNDSGNSLMYSTFLGGEHWDYGNSIALDGNWNVYVAGQTQSADFPTTSGAYDITLGGYSDIFVTRFLFEDPDRYITLISPSGREKWGMEDVREIIWRSNGLDNVTIEYSSDNGTSWNTIAESVDASGESYTWTVPDVESDNYLIRISDTVDPAASDVSNDTFSVVSSYITLTCPNGGEIWQSESSYGITWESAGVGTVKIEYSGDNGANWDIITESADAYTRS